MRVTFYRGVALIAVLVSELMTSTATHQIVPSDAKYTDLDKVYAQLQDEIEEEDSTSMENNLLSQVRQDYKRAARKINKVSKTTENQKQGGVQNNRSGARGGSSRSSGRGSSSRSSRSSRDSSRGGSSSRNSNPNKPKSSEKRTIKKNGE